MFPIASASVRIQPDFTGFAAATTAGTNQAIASTAASARQLGAGLSAAVTLPVAAIGVGAVRAFGNFDQAITQSLAIVEDFGATTRADFEKTARDVAKSTTFSAAEAAEAFFFLASAGLSAEQQLEALPQVAAFAQAGMFDMATATDLATDAQSALGLTVPDVEQNLENLTRVTDVLVKANTLANASVEQFSTSLTNKAGTALKLVNKDIEEGAAVLAVYADKGIKGQIAGENLSRVIRTLNINAVQNAEAFEALNITVFDQEGNMRNLADIVEDLTAAFAPMNDEQKTAALLSLGFTARSQDVIKALLGTEDAIRSYESALRDAGGITETVANRQLESFEAKLALAKSRITDVAISLGQELAPVVLTVIEGIAKLVELFAGAPAPIKQTVAALALVGALAGPILLIGGSIAKSILAFRALAGAQTAGAVAANQYAAAQGAAAIATQGAGAAAGQAALATSGARIVNASNPALINGVAGRAGFLSTGLGSLVKAGGFALGGNLIGGLVQGIATEEGTVQDTVKDVAGNAIRGAGLGAAVGSVVPIVGTGLGAAVGGAIGAGIGLFTSNNGEAIDDAVADTRGRIAQALEGFGLSDREQQAVASILDAQIAATVQQGIDGGFDTIEAAGLGDFGEGVIASLLEQGIDPAQLADEAIAPRILAGFQQGLSAGRVADQIGRDIRSGALGFAEAGADAADELAEGFEDEIPNAFQDAFNLVREAGGSITEAFNIAAQSGEPIDLGFVADQIVGGLSTIPSIFEEQFEAGKTVSTAKILEIAQANADAFATFESDIRTLAEGGMVALADTLAEKGPAAAAEAAALAADIPTAIAIEAELSDLGRDGVAAFLAEFENADSATVAAEFIKRFVDPTSKAALEAEATAQAEAYTNTIQSVVDNAPTGAFSDYGTRGADAVNAPEGISEESAALIADGFIGTMGSSFDEGDTTGFDNFGNAGLGAVSTVLSIQAAAGIANPFVAEINRILSNATFSVAPPSISSPTISGGGGPPQNVGAGVQPTASSNTTFNFYNPTVQSADRDAQKALVLDRLVGVT